MPSCTPASPRRSSQFNSMPSCRTRRCTPSRYGRLTTSPSTCRSAAAHSITAGLERSTIGNGLLVANTALVPACWRFDLMAAYKIKPKVTLQFNIYNLMDKLLYRLRLHELGSAGSQPHLRAHARGTCSAGNRHPTSATEPPADSGVLSISVRKIQRRKPQTFKGANREQRIGAARSSRTGANAMMIHVPQVLIAGTGRALPRGDDQGRLGRWPRHRRPSIRQGEDSTCSCRRLRRKRASSASMVMAALGTNALFFSAVLPKQVFPPLFNRYDAGMTFGAHVDNAIRAYLDTPLQIRTDVSATLFISAPEDYDGGELVVEDTYGSPPGQAAGRRHDRLSGHQPAPRHADHPRLAHRVVLLDAKPDPRRRQARADVRSRYGDPAARH